MTQEEKDLLLKDLSARLPYGLYATVRDSEEKDDFQPFEVLGIKEDLVWVKNIMICVDHFDIIEVVKPYLRPMSSMTKEEKEKYHSLCYEESEILEFGEWVARVYYHDTIDSIDYLNSIHIDYRGLIEKDLALKAPKGMYNVK